MVQQRQQTNVQKFREAVRLLGAVNKKNAELQRTNQEGSNALQRVRTTLARYECENGRITSENERLTAELARFLEERKRHREQLEAIRDGKATASQLLGESTSEEKPQK